MSGNGRPDLRLVVSNDELTDSPEPVEVPRNTTAQEDAPIWVAFMRGYFRERGLDLKDCMQTFIAMPAGKRPKFENFSSHAQVTRENIAAQLGFNCVTGEGVENWSFANALMPIYEAIYHTSAARAVRSKTKDRFKRPLHKTSQYDQFEILLKITEDAREIEKFLKEFDPDINIKDLYKAHLTLFLDPSTLKRFVEVLDQGNKGARKEVVQWLLTDPQDFANAAIDHFMVKNHPSARGRGAVDLSIVDSSGAAPATVVHLRPLQ